MALPKITFPAGSTNMAFIVSEANGYQSREEIVVASGSGKLVGGMVLFRQTNGTYRPWADGDTNAAVLAENVDATSQAVKATGFVRMFEAQRALLVFAGTPTTPQKNTAIGQLAAAMVAMR